MNTDRNDECKEKLLALIDKFREEYEKAINGAVFYAPEIQDCDWYYDIMYLDDALTTTYYSIKRF